MCVYVRIIGERERANLVVRTERFSVFCIYIYICIYISDAAYVISNSTRACANQCKFAILAVALSVYPKLRVRLVHVFRVSDGALAFETASRGKHANPDGYVIIRWKEEPLGSQ